MSDLERREGKTPPVKGESEPETLTFRYNREERLKKLRVGTETRRRKPFFEPGRSGGKSGRRIVVVLLNLALIYAVVYFFVKPSNVFLRETKDGWGYELNVTALRGGKTLVGFTVRNETNEEEVFEETANVVLKILDRQGFDESYGKSVDRGTRLLPKEGTSIVFMFDKGELPRAAALELYLGDSEEPIFSERVRF